LVALKRRLPCSFRHPTQLPTFRHAEVRTQLATAPLPPLAAGHHVIHSTHDSAYWAKVTQGMDFSAEDRINFKQYNHIQERGLMA
jgi:hypothetical protein